MVALETAAELWMSLTDSGQTQWLEYSGLAGEMLLEEVSTLQASPSGTPFWTVSVRLARVNGPNEWMKHSFYQSSVLA